MQLTFVHVDGSKKGQTEVFSQPVVSVGRDPSNQLAFDPYKDVDVSTRHAQFLFQGEQLMIQDLGSRNGTFVNGQRVGSQPTPVPPAAIVQFGDKGPKVQVTYKAAPAAPGKKTQMIQDLQSQMQAQQKQAAASKSKTIVFFLFLLIVVGGGGGLYVWWSGRKEVKERIAKSETKLDRAKSDATSSEASKWAPADLKKAQDLEAEATKAKTAGDLALCASKLEDAVDAYTYAGTKAEREASKKRNVEVQTTIAQQTKVQDAKKDEADAKRKEEEQKRIKDLEDQLKLAKTKSDLKPKIDLALSSNKAAEIEPTLQALALIAKGSNDPDLNGWLAQLSKRLDDLKAMPQKLTKSAETAKPVVVALQTTAYALPANLGEKKTEIRELIAVAKGSGLVVNKDRIVTTKEVVEPWRFDERAMAMAKYWEKYGYTVHAKTDILFLDTAGVYTATATTDPGLDAPTATVIYKGADALVDKPNDYTLDFKGGTNVFQVQPHKRESGNIAVIQLKTPVASSVTLADEDAKPGDAVVVLAQQPTKEGSDQLGLFEQQTEITTHVGSGDVFLGVGGYNSWQGAPVLNADGKVVGFVEEVQGEWMRMMNTAAIRQAIGK